MCSHRDRERRGERDNVYADRGRKGESRGMEMDEERGRRKRKGKEGGREKEKHVPLHTHTLETQWCSSVLGRLWLLELLEISLRIPKSECPLLSPLGMLFCHQQSRAPPKLLWEARMEGQQSQFCGWAHPLTGARVWDTVEPEEW